MRKGRKTKYAIVIVTTLVILVGGLVWSAANKPSSNPEQPLAVGSCTSNQSVDDSWVRNATLNGDAKKHFEEEFDVSLDPMVSAAKEALFAMFTSEGPRNGSDFSVMKRHLTEKEVKRTNELLNGFMMNPVMMYFPQARFDIPAIDAQLKAKSDPETYVSLLELVPYKVDDLVIGSINPLKLQKVNKDCPSYEMKGIELAKSDNGEADIMFHIDITYKGLIPGTNTPATYVAPTTVVYSMIQDDSGKYRVNYGYAGTVDDDAQNITVTS